MKIPSDWALALKALKRSGFPEAVIAGGALRDLYNGRPVKDVDIFVQYRGAETVDMLSWAFGDKFHVSRMMPAEIVEYTENLADVAEIYNVVQPIYLCSLLPVIPADVDTDIPPVQVIALKEFRDIHNVLARIDLGLCQIGTEDGEHVVWTVAFADDVANHSMTVTRCESVGQLERTIKRFQRLSEKYSGFEFRIPREFQQYAPATTL